MVGENVVAQVQNLLYEVHRHHDLADVAVLLLGCRRPPPFFHADAILAPIVTPWFQLQFLLIQGPLCALPQDWVPVFFLPPVLPSLRKLMCVRWIAGPPLLSTPGCQWLTTWTCCLGGLSSLHGCYCNLAGLSDSCPLCLAPFAPPF